MPIREWKRRAGVTSGWSGTSTVASSLLMAKLRHCHFDPWQDLLVSVGDVIDRGPDSLRCLKLLRKSWIVAVRGNHEQMGLDALAMGSNRCGL